MTATFPAFSKTRQLLALAGWLALCFSAAASAAFVSTGGWYAALNKPSWNPPNWLFGPVWTLLYVMMAIAAWLVWKQGGWPAQSRALTLFIAQWLLNALWTPLFFGAHRPDWALVEIIVFWLALAATLRAFYPVNKTAGLLLVPYLAWVSFASFLNLTILRLNS